MLCFYVFKHYQIQFERTKILHTTSRKYTAVYWYITRHFKLGVHSIHFYWNQIYTNTADCSSRHALFRLNFNCITRRVVSSYQIQWYCVSFAFRQLSHIAFDDVHWKNEEKLKSTGEKRNRQRLVETMSERTLNWRRGRANKWIRIRAKLKRACTVVEVTKIIWLLLRYLWRERNY